MYRHTISSRVRSLRYELGADVNIANQDGVEPIQETSAVGSEKGTKLLLKHGADLHGADALGRPPIHHAYNSECEAPAHYQGSVVVYFILIMCDIDAYNRLQTFN